MESAIVTRSLSFQYHGESCFFAQSNRPNALSGLSINVPFGARVAVVGGNGAGKSTFLKILGGKMMVPETAVSVLGRPAFHDTTLAQDVAYLGDWWRAEFHLDIPVLACLGDLATTPRSKRLTKLLGVDHSWRISRISDGQRRSVQLLLHFSEPKKVYLLDEATTDLDLVARDSLLNLLRQETEERNATVLYATHIFDNLDGWASHILYLKRGKVQVFSRIEDVGPYQALLDENVLNPFWTMVRNWLYEEKAEQNTQETA